MAEVEKISKSWCDCLKGTENQLNSEIGFQKEINFEKLNLDDLPSKKPLRILDIGCGSGFVSIIFAKSGHKVIGIDCTQGMIEIAKQNAEKCGVEVEFIQMDPHRLNFPDNSFDIIVSRNITWIIVDRTSAFQEWIRVLEHGGEILHFDGIYQKCLVYEDLMCQN